jgi:hypothetical protein
LTTQLHYEVNNTRPWHRDFYFTQSSHVLERNYSLGLRHSAMLPFCILYCQIRDEAQSKCRD